VERFTDPDALVETDEDDRYTPLKRPPIPVGHGAQAWARDDDGAGG
jgi:hypothetical protein